MNSSSTHSFNISKTLDIFIQISAEGLVITIHTLKFLLQLIIVHRWINLDHWEQPIFYKLYSNHSILYLYLCLCNQTPETGTLPACTLFTFKENNHSFSFLIIKEDLHLTVLLFINEMTPTPDGVFGINSIAQHPLMWLHCNNEPATSPSLPCRIELFPSVRVPAGGQTWSSLMSKKPEFTE